MHLRRIATLIGVFLLAVLAVSCKTDKRFKPVYPVSGQVLFEGKPTPGALLAFRQVEGEDPWAKPSAAVGEDGSFTLSTYEANDGAPEGKYEVIIWWLPEGYNGPIEKGNKLPMRYLEQATSQLTAEVKKGENILPTFNLTK